MHVIKGRSARTARTTDERELLSRATGRMQAAKLIDLIDESAPDDGVVDVHEIEKFANGSRRIPLSEPEDAVVSAIVEGGADTTRRMSAVEWDAAVCAVESEIHSESTMRMSAIQSNELAALITPVEVSLVTEPPMQDPVVTFTTPRLALPLPAPIEMDVDMYMEPAASEPIVAPVRRAGNSWMIGAIIALAGAAAGLAAVLLA